MPKYNDPTGTTLVFIEAVNARMEREGITKSELSRRSGVSLRYLRAFLNGEGGSCRFAVADAIAEALGTSTFSLLRSGKKAATTEV